MLVFAEAADVQAVDYFVSSTTGSDLNSGLTEGSAFSTLNRVNALTLQPGDRVLFRSGDTWQGMLWPKGSGTPVLPISIGSYGGSERPAIDDDSPGHAPRHT